MTIKINLNADMAEGFGAYDIGDDADLMKIIGSANIACGFHAGDPTHHADGLYAMAKREGVTIGVHPGFNDLWGFGRRRIDMRPEDLEYMVAYQIGALQAMATYSDVKVTHLKPHGALNNMAAENRDTPWRSAGPSRAVDPQHHLSSRCPAREMEKAGRELGLQGGAWKGFCDRQYDDDGNLDVAQDPRHGHQGSRRRGQQVVDMVVNNTITSRSGKKIPCKVHSLCVHGDEPTGGCVGSSGPRSARESAGVSLCR